MKSSPDLVVKSHEVVHSQGSSVWRKPPGPCPGTPARAAARATAPPRATRTHEPQPLEQGLQGLAPGVHPHDPPPAAAARPRTHVQGEDPPQQRRPHRRTLTRRSPRPGRRPRPGPRGRGPVLDSLGAPRNARRPPPRDRTEHPMNAQYVNAQGRNQQRQLLDQLQRIQQQVRGAVGPRMRQLEHQLPARALRQALQRQRRA